MILVSRAPIHKNGVVSSRADSTPVHVADVVKMTGEVLEEDGGLTSIGNQSGKGAIGKVNQSWKVPTGVRKQSGDASSSGLSASAANPVSKFSGGFY